MSDENLLIKIILAALLVCLLIFLFKKRILTYKFEFADIVTDGQNTGLIISDSSGTQFFVYLQRIQKTPMIVKINYSGLCAKRKSKFRPIKRINRKLSQHQMDSIILEVNKLSYYNVNNNGVLNYMYGHLGGNVLNNVSVQGAFVQKVLFNAGILDYYLGEIPDPNASQYLYFGPKIDYATMNLLPNYLSTDVK